VHVLFILVNDTGRGLACFGPRVGPTGQWAWRAGLYRVGKMNFLTRPMLFLSGWWAGPSGLVHFAIPSSDHRAFVGLFALWASLMGFFFQCGLFLALAHMGQAKPCGLGQIDTSMGWPDDSDGSCLTTWTNWVMLALMTQVLKNSI